MHELYEILHIRQIPGEHLRRWFYSVEMDLTVWCDDSGSITGFQLCYDRPRAVSGLTWPPENGFIDIAIDDGENSEGLGHKSTPIIIGEGHCDANRVHDIFLAASQRLPRPIAEFVVMTIRQHPNYSGSMLEGRDTN